MVTRKLYACYKTIHGSPVDIEFCSFHQKVYDEFVRTFHDALLVGGYDHMIIPSTDIENAPFKLNCMLDQYDINDEIVLSTPFYMDMFWEVDWFDAEIIQYLPHGRDFIQHLPRRLRNVILPTRWNKAALQEDINCAKLYYVVMNMYYRSCEFGDLFHLPKRLI